MLLRKRTTWWNLHSQNLSKKIFYTAYNQMVDTIKFYEVTRPKGVAAIPLTSKGKFDKVFTPVSSETLSISAKHDLQIFLLEV